MKPLLFSWEAQNSLVDSVAARLGAQVGALDRRRFPDGESYVRVLDDCSERPVILLAALSPPDERLLPLLLAAATLRDLGAKSIGLVSPYLPYMRQDATFHSGEGIAARHVGRIIAAHFDWLVTVDPHLHRFDDLADVYPLPTETLHAAPVIAQWVDENIDTPLLIGPDSESRQWVAAVAAHCDAPVEILTKQRFGDRHVEVSRPTGSVPDDHTPVLLDDIISSGQTMIEAMKGLTPKCARAPVCIAVHGVFAAGAEEGLMSAGAACIVTTNTVAHATNAIDLATLIADGCRGFLR
ncbi:MAG: ribose-phosphate diphosphokinase [Pseudomonadota bacterium]